MCVPQLAGDYCFVECVSVFAYLFECIFLCMCLTESVWLFVHMRLYNMIVTWTYTHTYIRSHIAICVRCGIYRMHTNRRAFNWMFSYRVVVVVAVIRMSVGAYLLLVWISIRPVRHSNSKSIRAVRICDSTFQFRNPTSQKLSINIMQPNII